MFVAEMIQERVIAELTVEILATDKRQYRRSRTGEGKLDWLAAAECRETVIGGWLLLSGNTVNEIP
jgi:hypothetical protein